MFDPARLRNRFVELCEIASPSGEERAVADHVRAELQRIGVECFEDGSAEAAGAGAGNIVARLPGRGPGGAGNSADESGSWLMFCAHLDTVPHPGAIEVLRDGDVFRSVGDTILGADNKAAVAVLLELIEGWAEAGNGGGDLLTEAGPPLGIELLFTVAEEVGLCGAQAFDPVQLKSGRGFVLDHATPIGEIIVSAPTHIRVSADFTGVEAHAGIRPEEGRSAIRAAALAVTKLPLGRLDSETTTNIGLIAGGSGGNIVPGSCRFVGEVRSRDTAQATGLVTTFAEVCADAAVHEGCDVAFSSEEVFRGYRLPAGSKTVALARRALERCGVVPVETHTGGGSDANALYAKGFECLLLANGTEANHTTEESVSGESLELMLKVCDTLLEEAAGC